MIFIISIYVLITSIDNARCFVVFFNLDDEKVNIADTLCEEHK